MLFFSRRAREVRQRTAAKKRCQAGPLTVGHPAAPLILVACAGTDVDSASAAPGRLAICCLFLSDGIDLPALYATPEAL